jgi:single-stranded DNA-binding protein
MSVRALVTGRLYGTPTRREGKSAPFTTAKLAADTDQGTAWVSLIAFGAAGERLAGLQDGAAIAVAGKAELRAYADKQGEPKASMGLVADEIVTLKRPKRERRQRSDAEPLGGVLDDDIAF